MALLPSSDASQHRVSSLLTELTMPEGCGTGWLSAAVIPPNPTRKHPHSYDRIAYRSRNLIERMFCRLKDFRRIATRYDKRADTFLSAVFIAAIITWWLN
nr:transposase [Pelagibius litoralis]